MKPLHAHTLNYYLAQSLPAMTSLIGLSLYISLAGKEAFGTFALIMSTILVIQAFSSTWLNQSILRYRTYSSSQTYKNNFKKIVLIGSAISSLIAAILTGITLSLTSNTYYTITNLLAILVSSSFVLYGTLGVNASSFLDSKRVLLSEASRAVITFSATIILLRYTGITGEVSLLAGVLSGLTAGIIMLSHGYTRKNAKTTSPDTSRTPQIHGMIESFIRYGGPLSIWMAIVQLHNLSDRYQISYFMNVENTAEYSAIHDIVYKFFGFALVPILSAAHPIIMNSWNEHDLKGALVTITQSLKLQIVISIGGLMTLFILRDVLVLFLLGEENHQSSSLVLPVAVGFMVWQMSMILQKILETTAKVHIMITLIILSLLVNVLGNHLFIPKYGYIAAAYTTLLSSLTYFSGILLYLYLSRNFIDNGNQEKPSSRH